MKLRNFRQHTFPICCAYLRHKTPKTLDRMIANLRRWARFHYKDPDMRSVEVDYGYKIEQPDDLYWHISYCSDRMSVGRAKALLRLLDEQATNQLAALCG